MQKWLKLFEGDAQIAPQQITHAIQSVTKAWLDSGEVSSIREIGQGSCYEFCEAVYEALGIAEDYQQETGRHGIEKMRTEDFWKDDFVASVALLKKAGEPIPTDIKRKDLEELVGAATHEWIRHANGMHFDATCPQGVPHMLAMPFFADQLDGFRKEMHLPKFVITISHSGGRTNSYWTRAENEAQAEQHAREQVADNPYLPADYEVISVERQK